MSLAESSRRFSSRLKVLSALVLIFSSGVALSAPSTSGAPAFSVPRLTGPVVDGAAMLSPSTRERLSSFLRRLHDEGGTQIQVLTVDNLGGLSIEEASIKVTDQWKLGTAKADNGILLMLSKQERRVRIEVGQGYEGDLPDVTASRIVREVILPQFKEGDFDRGVIDGVLAIVHYVNPQFLEGQNSVSPGGTKVSGLGFWLIMGWLLFFLVIPRIFGPRRRWLGSWEDWGGGGWGGGGFGGGGGWGGGSSGGGWSGGGGGFSGGGASGGW
jgi:uncharacterized protein